MSQKTSSNSIQTYKRTFVLNFERYVQEIAYAEVEAGSLAEAAEIARNLTWEEMDELEFDMNEVVDGTTRIYSIASEDGSECISVFGVEDDSTFVEHLVSDGGEILGEFRTVAIAVIEILFQRLADDRIERFGQVWIQRTNRGGITIDDLVDQRTLIVGSERQAASQ